MASSPVGIAVALARSEDTIPPSHALPGGCVYELKWDGYRMVAADGSGCVWLWSRQGTDLTGRFPDLAAALTGQLPARTTVDGEVVVWQGDRLSFDDLQRRMVTSPRSIAALVRQFPASYVAFDLLDDHGTDIRSQALTERRRRLEDLTASWVPPLQLTPATTDRQEAEAWFWGYRDAGIEGLVVKGANTPYRAGRRDWVKVKSRRVHRVIVGAVTGSLKRPDTVIAGRYVANRLIVVGRTGQLSDRQAAELARLLTPARFDHPFPDTITPNVFGAKDNRVALVKVEPVVVVEVSADAATHAGGRFRHPLRYLGAAPNPSNGE